MKLWRENASIIYLTLGVGFWWISLRTAEIDNILLSTAGFMFVYLAASTGESERIADAKRALESAAESCRHIAEELADYDARASDAAIEAGSRFRDLAERLPSA